MAQRARLKWNGDLVDGRMKVGAVRGLTKGTEHVLTESRKVVPIEEGTLERSGVASVDPATMQGAISYDTVYAVPQHENLDWQHDTGRQAKYLEEPLLRERDTVGAIVAAEIRRELRGAMEGR